MMLQKVEICGVVDSAKLTCEYVSLAYVRRANTAKLPHFMEQSYKYCLEFEKEIRYHIKEAEKEF